MQTNETKEASFLKLKLFQIGDKFSTYENALEFDNYTKKDILLYVSALWENGVPLSPMVQKYIQTYKELSASETTCGKDLMKLYSANYRACKSMIEKLPEFQEKSLIKAELVGYIVLKYIAGIRFKRNFEILKDTLDLALQINPKGRQFYLKLPDGKVENIEFEITFYKPNMEIVDEGEV